MAAFFRPAYAVLGRLRNEARFALMALLFALPLSLVAFAPRTPLTLQLTGISLGLLAYAAGGFYAQAMTGWNELLPQLQRLGNGELRATFSSSAHRVGHFAEVGRIAREIHGQFGRLVVQAQSGSERIGGVAQEIRSGNADLSQRCERQASTLEEIAGGMGQLSVTVKHNAAGCAAARALGEQANALAMRGEEMVGRVAHTMAGIDGSSKKVVHIVGVIERIAFQTNILALNAAVEAARAAGQGRGFAVVAAEVRSLAQSSAAAAKEIKVLIEASVSSAETGARLAGETRQVIAEAARSVDEATGRIREIAAASQEQSTGVDEVARALAQLSQLTERNAAAAQQATAAAASLTQEAGRLGQAIAMFRV